MRNQFLARCFLVFLGLFTAAAQAQPQFGPLDADFAPVDRAAREYLTRYDQPGVSVVVAVGERIVYAQGYGHADRERQIQASPWHEYRLASVSKTLTAAAVMRLVEQGRVMLDASAWRYVEQWMGIVPRDERVPSITVRQLLTHSWGLDRAMTAEPNGRYYADSEGQTITASRMLLQRYLQNNRLDFAPGARYAYNGIGYSWLQLIAELVDGRPLAQQLSEWLGAEPLSSGRVRIGETLPSRLTLAEPRYYDSPVAPKVAPVPGLFPAPEPATVARPDGGFTLDAFGGGGGLVASPFTLVRFIQRLQGLRQPALLEASSWAQMQAEQPLADGTRNIGLGLNALRAWDYASDRWYHFNGQIPGTRTGWVSTPRVPGGPRLTVVALVNGIRDGASETGSSSENVMAELVFPILAAVDSIGVAKYSAKPEIGGDRLLLWDSPTEAFYADLLFDWGQRVYPDLLKGVPVQGTFDGYRYRYYAATQTYVGIKQGRVYLYQPTAGPAINFIRTMGDLLPEAVRALP